jgi:hypothetical protein
MAIQFEINQFNQDIDGKYLCTINQEQKVHLTPAEMQAKVSRLFQTTCKSEPAPKIMEHVNYQLPPSGILREHKGFVYVDLDDDYIHDVVKFIQDEGFQKPPYFGKADLVGAHISVMFPSELKKHNITKIDECGQRIFFKIKSCAVVYPARMKVNSVYIITVDSKELNTIREKYSLPKPEHDFHITIGITPKKARL